MNGIVEELVPGNCPPKVSKQNVGSVDGFGFTLQQPDATDVLLAYDWPFGGRISQLRISAAIGTGIVSVLINGAATIGLDHVPVAAGARSQHNATGYNNFMPGDDIVLRIDGANNLQDVKGTLVITNKTIYGLTEERPSGLVLDQKLITGNLVGLEIIPITVSLRRAPQYVFLPTFTKSDPNQDNIYSTGLDATPTKDGWSYRLNGPAVEGQTMRFGYIK